MEAQSFHSQTPNPAVSLQATMTFMHLNLYPGSLKGKDLETEAKGNWKLPGHTPKRLCENDLEPRTPDHDDV